MSAPTDSATHRETVLIVDDVPSNLSVLGDVLAPHYAVRAANSGGRALRIAASDPQPDLILLDIMMPDLDGYEVLTQLRHDERTRDIPVIFVTTMDGLVDEEKGFALGGVDYITKPIRPTIVLARVRAQLELKRVRDWLRDQNTFLEAEVQRRMADNQLAQDFSIRALARLAQARDPETGNHLLRTQGYVQMLAELLLVAQPRHAAELSAERMALIVKSAPLHDIGKVGIPDHILLKAGQLSDAEWRVMRQHPLLGFEAIEAAERDAERPIPFLSMAKEICRSHHEKWDGSGYPDGLRGEDIPLSARLMALADGFDAIISRRTYKEQMTPMQAAERIAAARGSHFDPEIVDVFLAHQPRFVEIARRHADSEQELQAKVERLRKDTL